MKKNKLVQLGVVTAVVLAAYFINVEVQSYLGRKAVNNFSFQVNDLDQALALAKKESKLVLADLSAIWCPSCRKLDTQVLSDIRVSERIKQDYVFARVEYESEEGAAFMARYQVSGFPNLVVLDADGNLLRKPAITFNPDQFLKNLEP